MISTRQFRESVRTFWLLGTILLLSNLPSEAQTAQSIGRVIEILADHDSRFKIAGQKEAAITVKAGEQITLRITAKKAKNVNRLGAVHGFTLLRAKDRKPVDNWDFMLQPGTQEFTVAAPSEAGQYEVVCTVICGPDHEGMSLKLVVLP